MINVFQPSLAAEELAAVKTVFASNWIGKGALVEQFEFEWSQHIDAGPEQCVSISSCTEGLFQAIDLLGIGPGDEVIIPSIHFVGAAQAVLAAGATPVFCDVDSRTLNTTLDRIQMATNPKRPKVAVILNHYGGAPCSDLQAIREWCDYIGIWLIEDAACAPAATYHGQAVGTFGDIGVWSFDAMKIMSTGDGGMVYCKDPEMAERLRRKIYLGTDSEAGLTSDKAKWWEFTVTMPGARRAIMNDVQAAIGLVQLERLSGFIERRFEIHVTYNDRLRDYVSIPKLNDRIFTRENIPSFYFYWIQTPHRDDLARYLRRHDIYTTFRYHPLHWAYKTGDSLPGAEQAARETLLLPLHQGLSDSEVEYICDKVKEWTS